MTFDCTYLWTCSCRAEVLIIRRAESAPLDRATCPACGLVALISPTSRREHRPELASLAPPTAAAKPTEGAA
jgi:hypothetical protein